MVTVDYDYEHPWRRQPFDSDISWPVFHRYLMQERRPRSLQVLVKEGCPYTWGQIQDQAWRDAWAERARAWDAIGEVEAEGAYLGAVRSKAAAAGETMGERSKRQAALGRRLQAVSNRTLDQLERTLERAPDFPILTPRELIRAADIGVRIERTAMGENDAPTDGNGPDLSALTVDELREWRRLMAKAKVA